VGAFRNRGIEIKTPAQIALMRKAGLAVADALAAVQEAVAPGVTTKQLDLVAEDVIRSRGATSNFLGYHGYPATICVSVNDEVVHGIPGDRILQDGDLVSIDCGAIVDGWHGDAAVTVPVGTVPDRLQALMRACEDALWQGLAAARLGGRVTDISAAVESSVRSAGSYGIVEDYVGHGIGSAMHMPPSVPNYGPPGKGAKLVAGMALAVEPMITLGGIDTSVLEDDWTVVTTDGSWAAHFEHSFALTGDGVIVLTAADGGEQQLRALGVPCAA
jgi:methionyl aminopeptidase